jgi:hypothetical protein
VRLARSSGSEEHALIELGKAMAPEREADRWMAYVDAGAVCYYSDWNAYDTMGLNTRQIAQRSVDPWQVYGYPHTDLVLLNVGDYTDTIRPPAAHEMAGRLRRLGYQYAGRVPIGADGAKQHWDVLLFARDLPRAQSLLRSVRVAGLTESRKRIWYSESLALPGPHPTTHFVGTRPLRGYPALPRTAGREGIAARRFFPGLFLTFHQAAWFM